MSDRKILVTLKEDKRICIIVEHDNWEIGQSLTPSEAREVRNKIDMLLKEIELKDQG